MPWRIEELAKGERRISRNVVVQGRRTSMRIEETLWDALEDMAAREGVSINELCGRIDYYKGEMSLTGAVRAALVSYYLCALRRNEERPPGPNSIVC